MSVPALVVGIATASTYVTPIDAGASWLFFGISLIVAAFRGDAGCEVLAFERHQRPSRPPRDASHSRPST